MARFNTLINAFLGGEVSPKAWSRRDAPLYPQACKTLLNMVAYPQGGAGRRAGSQFVTDTFSAKSAIRCIPYDPTGEPEYAYMLLFTTDDLKSVKVTTGAVSSSISVVRMDSGADSAVFTWDFTATELQELQFAQAGIYLWITHPTAGTFCIYDSSLGTGTFVAANLIYMMTATFMANGEKLIPPTRQKNINTGRLIKVTDCSSAVGATSNFSTSNITLTSAFVNKVYRLDGTTSTAIIRIKTVASASTGTCELLKVMTAGANESDLWDATSANGHYNWYECAVSDHTGWFNSVAYHEQRVYFGGTPVDPLTSWASQIGDVSEYKSPRYLDDSNPTTVDNSDAYFFTIAATRAGSIKWLSEGESLAIGCTSREFTAVGNEGAMGPTDIEVKPRTTYGSAYIQGLRQDSVAMFVTRSGQVVRDMVFDYRENSYRSTNLILFAEHIVRKALSYYASYSAPKIIAMAKQESDATYVWYIDNNGGLFGQTREREYQVNAWHSHKMGGALSSEAPKVTSIATIIAADGRHQDLWVVVKRTINSGTKFYVEKIGKEFELDDLDNSSTSIADKPVYMDSCKMVQSAAALTFAGFSHLEGQTVEVVGNGSYLGTATVSGGSVTIPGSTQKTEVLVGLGYDNVLEILPVEAGSVIGSAMGSLNRIDKIYGEFVRTVAAKHGPSESNLMDIVFRETSVAANEPTPLFTGDKELSFDGTYTNKATVVIKNSVPLPCALSGIVIRGQAND